MQQSHSLFGAEPQLAMAPTLSKRGFAERIGLTAARVSQMIAAGLPVEPNGRIDPQKGDAWISANVDPNRRRWSPRSADDLPARGAPISAKAEREEADAMTARLKAERLAGNLIDRGAALRAIESRARMDRDRWISWVNRAAPEIANTFGADMPAVVALLDRMVRDQLAVLADTPIEGVTER